jgi:hypothetical protein
MRILRHPPLLFWVLVCAVLGTLIVTGAGSSQTAIVPTASAPVDVYREVMVISERAAAMNAVAAGAAFELSSWATAFADEVDAARTRHGGNDAVAAAYEDVSARARVLAGTDPANAEAVLRAKTELSLAVLALKTAALRPGGFSSASSPSL